MKKKVKEKKEKTETKFGRFMRTFLSTIIFIILLAAEGLTFFKILSFDMVPMKYLAILLAVLVVITLILAILLFPSKKKKRRRAFGFRQLVAYTLTLAMAFGCFAGYQPILKLYQTFNAITSHSTIAAQVGVYVLADDSAQTLKDTSKYKFGFTDSYDAENANLALSGIEELLKTSLKVSNYDTTFSMIDALYAGNVQAILLNSAYMSILNETEAYADFSSKTKLLYEYTVTKTNDSTVHSNQIDEPFVMYLSGSDTRSKVLTKSRSDVNILAVVNPKTKQILLINTPRDYYIPNPAGKGALDKLTHCGIYGVECSMEALSNLYNQPVTYYAQINFTGFETLINAIGGISIYSEKGDGALLRPGENKMNGQQALAFARNRYSYASGDNARGEHQMQVITAVVDKLTSGAAVTNYSEILDSLQGMFVTSMPGEILSAYIKMQLSDNAHWDVFSYAVTGTGSSKIPYSMPGTYASVMLPNQETVAHASQLIGRVLDDKTLTEADIPLTPKQ